MDNDGSDFLIHLQLARHSNFSSLQIPSSDILGEHLSEKICKLTDLKKSGENGWFLAYMLPSSLKLKSIFECITKLIWSFWKVLAHHRLPCYIFWWIWIKLNIRKLSNCLASNYWMDFLRWKMKHQIEQNV